MEKSLNGKSQRMEIALQPSILHLKYAIIPSFFFTERMALSKLPDTKGSLRATWGYATSAFSIQATSQT